MAMTGIAAGAIDLLHDDRRLGETEPRAAILLRAHRGEPAGLGQRVDELDGIGRVRIVLAVILGGKLGTERAQRLAHLLVTVGLGDHRPPSASRSPRPNSARIASVCSPSAGTGSRRGSQ